MRLQRCTIMDDAVVKAHTWINSAIIGWKSVIGAWVRLEQFTASDITMQVRIEGVTVLGEDVTVRDELFINGAKVLPHKELGDNVPTPTIIM